MDSQIIQPKYILLFVSIASVLWGYFYLVPHKNSIVPLQSIPAAQQQVPSQKGDVLGISDSALNSIPQPTPTEDITPTLEALSRYISSTNPKSTPKPTPTSTSQVLGTSTVAPTVTPQPTYDSVADGGPDVTVDARKKAVFLEMHASLAFENIRKGFKPKKAIAKDGTETVFEYFQLGGKDIIKSSNNSNFGTTIIVFKDSKLQQIINDEIGAYFCYYSNNILDSCTNTTLGSITFSYTTKFTQSQNTIQDSLSTYTYNGMTMKSLQNSTETFTFN